MKSLFSFFAFASAVCAGTPVAPSAPVTAAPHVHEDLTPQGLMFAHSHSAGDWMVGYRYMFSRADGLLRGTDSIGPDVVFDTEAFPGTHYSAAMQRMDMSMHMLDIMWAPSDNLTLMVMPQYVEMDMTMLHGGHHAEAGGEHGHGAAMEEGVHSHGTSGWGDTRVMSLWTFWRSGMQSLALNLGVSIPTGSVDQRVGGTFTHYMMQLGSGTWDVLPGLTYSGHNDRYAWGAQVLGTVRLQDENDSGYRLGHAVDATVWGAAKLSESLSLSARVTYHAEESIQNHYNGPHGHSSPVDFQRNYGGQSVDVGLGLNYFFGKHRLGIEALTPIYQDVNGIQLNREVSLAVGWQMSF